MVDITLSDGREITFDLTKLTLREYRALFDKKQTQAEEDETLSKVGGLTAEEYADLSLYDSKRYVQAFIKKAREPIDPN